MTEGRHERDTDVWLDLGNPYDDGKAMEDLAANRGRILRTGDA